MRAIHLRRSHHPSYPQIGPKATAALVAWLPSASQLKSLHMSRTSLGDGTATPILQALVDTESLTSLDLSDNDIGVVGSAALGQLIGMLPALRHLDISWNKLGVDVSTCATAEVQHARRLTRTACREGALLLKGWRTAQAFATSTSVGTASRMKRARSSATA